MKKILLLSFVCLAVVFSSCNKRTDTYKTSFSYDFASQDNKASVEVLIKSYNWVWLGDKTIKGVDLNGNDASAYLSFKTSLADIILHSNDFKDYFATGDSFDYILTRTTDGSNKVIYQSHIQMDANNNLNDLTVVDKLGEE